MIEIERKFLITETSFLKKLTGTNYTQGYLSTDPHKTVRVRIAGRTGFLTIKGKTQNISRTEFEYEIPLNDAQELIKLCDKPIIEKTRYLVTVDQHIWEVDIFEGENKGLIIAEIELKSENEKFTSPDWLGKEVSSDKRYYNSLLIKKPYSTWEN